MMEWRRLKRPWRSMEAEKVSLGVRGTSSGRKREGLKEIGLRLDSEEEEEEEDDDDDEEDDEEEEEEEENNSL